MDAAFAEAALGEILEKEQEDARSGFLVAGLFPPYEPNWFLKVTAELCYHQHGGSGFSFTPRDVAQMDIDEIEFYLDWLDERRSEEAKRIRQASR